MMFSFCSLKNPFEEHTCFGLAILFMSLILSPKLNQHQILVSDINEDTNYQLDPQQLYKKQCPTDQDQVVLMFFLEVTCQRALSSSFKVHRTFTSTQYDQLLSRLRYLILSTFLLFLFV